MRYIVKMKSVVIGIVLFFNCFILFAEAIGFPPMNVPSMDAEFSLPPAYKALRDSVYNSAETEKEISSLYDVAIAEADSHTESDSWHSAVEYLYGMYYIYAGNKEKAEKCFDSGVTYGERAKDRDDTAFARLVWLKNISQSCSVKPVSFILHWGPKIEKLARQVLEKQDKNGAALLLEYMQMLYAPSPWGNYTKGITVMQNLLSNASVLFYKDDFFNLYSGVGYAYGQLGDYVQALAWYGKSLRIYPDNVFVKKAITDIQAKIK